MNGKSHKQEQQKLTLQENYVANECVNNISCIYGDNHGPSKSDHDKNG